MVERTISSLIESNRIGYERNPSAEGYPSNEVLIQERCCGAFGRSRALVLIIHVRHLQSRAEVSALSSPLLLGVDVSSSSP